MSLSSTDVQTKSNVAESQRSSEECVHLVEFKEFLREFANDCKSGGERHGVGGAEPKNCVTRSSSDTYSVTVAELQAELQMTVLSQLQARRCPPLFQVRLMHVAMEGVEQELKSDKAIKDLRYRDSQCQYSSDELTEPQYDLLKLQKLAGNSLEKLLTRLTDNARAADLVSYSQCKCGLEKDCRKQQEGLPRLYAVAHMKNKPRKMEDRHTCLPYFGEMEYLRENYSFYGVFDGHSGVLAANYVAAQLPHLLAGQLRNIKPSSSMDRSVAYREAFEACFLQADKLFCQKRISSGSTAVCALIAYDSYDSTVKHLFVAWVGDSKALLVSPTVPLQLVKSHKPDSPDERKRIESMETGGAVMLVQGQWRVNGIINVSRSIGDYSVGAVIAEPDFVDVALTAAHDFLVLGTDGLWDYVAESEIVRTVYTALAEADHLLEDIPKDLVELAKQGDSQDNITVVVVLLKERSKIVENYKKHTH